MKQQEELTLSAAFDAWRHAHALRLYLEHEWLARFRNKRSATYRNGLRALSRRKAESEALLAVLARLMAVGGPKALPWPDTRPTEPTEAKGERVGYERIRAARLAAAHEKAKAVVAEARAEKKRKANERR
jgi:hypothetical protein